MAKRLVKVAKEFNVGLSTIVDHLNDKGFAIESKPTAKVTDEMMTELLKAFQSSRATKQKADSLVIGTRPTSEPDTPAPPVVKAPPVVAPPPVPRPVVQQRPPVVQTPTSPKPTPVVQQRPPQPAAPAKPAPPPVEAKQPEAPRPEPAAPDNGRPTFGLKVKGKIDLDNIGKPKPKPKAETPAPKPKADTPAAPQPAAESPAKPAPAPGAAKDTPATPTEGTPAPAADAKPDAPADGVVRAKTPALRGLKIMGKIKLPTKPKPVASSDDAAPGKGRRRRRRLSTGGGGGASDRGGRGGAGRGGRRDDRQEVTKKEIDEKIRATMARISGSGKKRRQRMRRDNRDRMREQREADAAQRETGTLQVTEFVTVQELANLMDVPVTEVITACLNLGVMVSINQRLDAEIIELVAGEFDQEVEFISAEEATDEEEEIVDNPEDLVERAPIVTVMGHVDHGKTSLLDYIRNASVADGEAGGITQHIGAYEVSLNGKNITFLDTPGHEAFTAMRARGAKVTDIAIVIVAADDSIMPQTKEAISHAQAAGVPIIFAINKIDKDGANPDKIKADLAAMNLQVEEWGGEYQSEDISALKGTNVAELLEKVLLQAELLELKANPERNAVGAVLEASLDKGRGYVTKMLVQTGTLEIGDVILAGEYSGKVKAMFNERGERVKEAGPATPVLVLGLDGAPQAGERIKVMDSEQEARQLAARRGQINREQANRATKRISLDEIGRRLALGTFKELNLIVKGDTDGSVEALSDALIKQSIETVQVNVIHKAVGQIIESDILLASASDAIIVGFQVRPSVSARRLAEQEGVQIKLYSVIYEAIGEVRSAIEGLLEPTQEEKITATVAVREVYKISKIGTVAGCYVEEGKISRNNYVRVIRDGIVVFPVKEGAKGELGSLKRFKEDVKEVRTGFECGLTIKGFNDIKEGDEVEAYEIVSVKQTLDKV